MFRGNFESAFVVNSIVNQMLLGGVAMANDNTASAFDNLSREKKFLLGLSDKDLTELLRVALDAYDSGKTSQKKAIKASNGWFDGQICGLSKDAQEALKEAETEIRNNRNSQHVEKKWLRYARKFSQMTLEKPLHFVSEPREMYQKLQKFCKEHDLPDEIVSFMVPSLINYMETGHMRPIMFIGDKGCGKTTCAKLLLQEALSIPVEVIKVPEATYGHGMTGDSGTYKSADLGSLAKAQYKNDSLIVGFVIDEIDKVPGDIPQATIDEELLSITDDSVSTVEDKYLESLLVGLPYCPICFTGNEFENVNPILADRCTIIKYPNPTPERMKSIMKKYLEKRLSEKTYSLIDFDFELMNEQIDEMITKGITSIRKHQEVAESVLNKAFNYAMQCDETEKAKTTRVMFQEAVNEVAGGEKRKMGFH